MCVVYWVVFKVKGIVLLFSGCMEYIEKYVVMVVDFVEYGYGVYVIDWCGQGFVDCVVDDYCVGYVDDFVDY